MIHALLAVLFPVSCIGCEKVLLDQETHICLNCELELPVTNYQNETNNPLAKTFWGRVKFEFAFAYLVYKKAGLVKRIVQAIKYKGNKQLAYDFGQRLGQQIKLQIHQNGVNALIAVPLHPKRLKQRGFNQSELIVQGIASVTHIQNKSEYIKRTVHTPTQTAKSRIERWENVLSIYEVDKQLFQQNGQCHFLLVDDVVTTGATVESLAKELLKMGNCKLSVAALAFAP
jgi:ComF family protein